MALAEVPFDLVEVKLAAPLTRPGTVAKTSLIARLCTSVAPFATVVAPAGIRQDDAAFLPGCPRISRNTAKTEAVAIYRKFGVSSRSEAIERAVQVGASRQLRPPAAGESHPEWVTRRRPRALMIAP